MSGVTYAGGAARGDPCPSCSKSPSAIESAQTSRKNADCQGSSGPQRSWSSDVARMREPTSPASQVSFLLRGHSYYLTADGSSVSEVASLVDMIRSYTLDSYENSKKDQKNILHNRNTARQNDILHI